MATRGGCAVKGCLGVLMAALVLVIGAVVWLGTAPGRWQDQARDNMMQGVAASKNRLVRASADGTLLGTEIQRAVRTTGKGAVDIRRQGSRVTVTAEFMGMGPGLGGSGEATGCYRFDIVPPSVSAHEISEKVCRDRPYAPVFRSPAEVAQDVVAELRAALSRDGLTGVQDAEVWQTYGIDIQDRETKSGQLVTLAWLLKGPSLRGRVCYEFRVQDKPRTVTAKKLTQDGCYRIRRAEEARQKAAQRAELDESAGKIEHRIDHALADGRLTDGELADALALPRTDSMGGPAHDDPVAVPVGVRRPSSEVVVLAKVNALQQTAWNEGCYEFRARLTTRSVTRRAVGTDCLGKAQWRAGSG
ncbi:hypothetical protein AB5J56_08780 [Streptomyces sp. R21]|uniref:Uncharacterized protein n=1 Tax=Streptomyces sp. R21 TaxID=3238627 RepID=A0AB39P4R7_9ACTN